MTSDQLPTPAETIARSDDLERRLANAAPSVKDVVVMVGRVRRQQRITNAIIAVLIVMNLILTFVVYKVSDNSDRLRRTDHTLEQQCKDRNEARAGNRELWEYILGVPRPASAPPQSAEQLEAAAHVREIIERVFAQLPCE